MSKAFDTIDYTILLDNLYRYGIRGVTLNWFKRYLNDMKQFVSYNNTTSGSMKVTFGRGGEGRGGEGRGGVTVIHILIGMFTSNPMIPQY